MSDSVQPHRWQPTRLLRPWDSPGKNTGVGCHFLLQSMKVKSESEVTQSCPNLIDPMDCSLPGSPVHGIFQAKVLRSELKNYTITSVALYWFSQVTSESESHSVMSNSLRPHGLHSPWDSPGQNTGVGSLSLLPGIFPT